jgi:hypothetical protein
LQGRMAKRLAANAAKPKDDAVVIIIVIGHGVFRNLELADDSRLHRWF